MNKTVRRFKHHNKRNKSFEMDVCYPDESSDSGLDVSSRNESRSNELERDSCDSIDSGIFGISSGDDQSSSDTCLDSNAVIEESGLANLLCQSISIGEEDKSVDEFDQPQSKRRCLADKMPERIEDFQAQLSGSVSHINFYGVASQTDRPQLTPYKSGSGVKSSFTSNNSFNQRKKLNRKPPALHISYPNRIRDGQIDLRILSQPEEQHRARYMTEGSRGAIKDRRGSGFPTVKLFGYNQPVTLQVFIGNDQGKIQPHLFYQACKVSGKNCTPCNERVIDGTTVIEILMLPDKDMTVSCDCIGILKERNVDVEQRLPYFNMTRAKKKNTRCRMIFRVNLPSSEVGVETLQTSSSPILCTQPPGVPEICKKSIKECSVMGGTELFIIGKNFLKDTKIIFEEELSDGENEMNNFWQEVVEPEKEFLHQTHLVCHVPPYHLNVREPVKVQLTVQSGGKTSEPHTFIYLPEKQGLDNFSENVQTFTPDAPETSQQLPHSQLMPAFIQVTAPLTPAPVLVSQPSNIITFPPVQDVKPTFALKEVPKTPITQEDNSNQIHVVVLQQTENKKKFNQLSSANRNKNNYYSGKRFHRLHHNRRFIASKGKVYQHHPYRSHLGGYKQVNNILAEETNPAVLQTPTFMSQMPPTTVEAQNDINNIGLLSTVNQMESNMQMIENIDILQSSSLGNEQNLMTAIGIQPLTTNTEDNMQRQNELMDQSIILNGEVNSRSNEGQLNSDMGFTLMEPTQLPTHEGIINVMKEEIESKVFSGVECLQNSQLVNGGLKTELLTPNSSTTLHQSPPFIPMHSPESTSQMSPIFPIASKQIFTSDVNGLNQSLATTAPMTQLKMEPLLSPSQIESLSSAHVNANNNLVPATTACLPTTNDYKFASVDVKQEKINTPVNQQCDMNMFQHTMTSALSILSDSDLLSLINPTAFDHV